MAVIGHPGPCDICTQIYYIRGVDKLSQEGGPTVTSDN